MAQELYNSPKMAFRRISDDDGAENDVESGGELDIDEGDLDEEEDVDEA